MKFLYILLCTAAAAAPVRAGAMELGESYAALARKQTAVEAPRVPPPAGNSLTGRFCWTGTPDQDVAGLGVPGFFCVSSARIIRSGDGYAAEISGQPYETRQRAAWKTGKGWKVSFFQNGESDGACSDARHAAVNMEFSVDELGYMTGVPAVEAYYEETTDTCHSQYDRREIKFYRSGPGAARYAWGRVSSPLADALGMPAEVSLEGFYVEEGRLVIEKGSPFAGSFPVRFRRTEGGRLAEAALFSADTGGACTSGTMAALGVSFPVGPDGTVLGAPEILASTGETWDVCHSPFEYSEVKFVLK